MANDKKMDYVILGLLSHQPMTGYEIKKRIDTSLHFFWNGSFGSIYPTLNSLAEKKMIEKCDEDGGGRGKISYAITEDGREYLRAWLAMPVVKDELRYETLLKLFFGEELGREGTLHHIVRFEEKIKGELAVLQMIEESLKQCQEEEAHKYYLATVMFGIETYKGYLNWCNNVKKVLGEK